MLIRNVFLIIVVEADKSTSWTMTNKEEKLGICPVFPLQIVPQGNQNTNSW